MSKMVRSKAGRTVMAVMLMAGTVVTADASVLVEQKALPGACIPQFAVPLPVFGPAGPIPRVNALGHRDITVTMKETEQAVLPSGPFFCPDLNANVTPGKTRVWAYEISDSKTNKLLAPAHWPAVTVEARRGTPTTVTYVNQLPQFGQAITINGAPATGLVQGLMTVDQTIDWSDPLNAAQRAGCLDFPQNLSLPEECLQPYQGPAPAVPHLHGGEVSSRFDGGPLAWFTPDGRVGSQYQTLQDAGPGKAVYLYNNAQEPGTLWFHDHTMGQTRTNVYSGLAAFYFLEDPRHPAAGSAAGCL